MIRKAIIFFLGFFLFIGGTFVSAKKFDLNYFFHQPDTVLSPQFPWYSERPKSVFDFLSSRNTPLRDQWQVKQPIIPYRFSRNFKRSDYERWRDLELRGFSIVDEEDESGQSCNYENSIITNEFLTNLEIEGRCCVCSTGGEWQCQYTHVKEGRVCESFDLAISNIEFIEDLSFSTFVERRFNFDVVLKNISTVDSLAFTVSVYRDDEQLDSLYFPNGLGESQQLTLSESSFSSLYNGISVPVGEHTIKLVVSATGEFEEQNIDNNSYEEDVTVLLPQNDFLIRSVNISQTGNINIEDQQEIEFNVILKNEGDPFAIVPSNYSIELLTDPSFPAFYSENISETLLPGNSSSANFSIYADPDDYVFFIKVIPDTEEEENLENNISEVPFTVY